MLTFFYNFLDIKVEIILKSLSLILNVSSLEGLARHV